MRPATRRLTLGVLLLLGPTVLVGWLGLSQISGLEEALAATMSRSTAAILRTAEESYGLLLEDVARDALRELDGLTVKETREALAALPHVAPRSPVIASVLVGPDGQPAWPRLSRTTDLQLGPSGAQDSPVGQLLRRIREAEFFATNAEFDEALGVLERVDPDPLPASGRGRLYYERARLLRRLKRQEEAREMFVRARRELATQELNEPRMEALSLMVRLGEVESVAAGATPGDGPGATRGQELAREVVALLEGITAGDFDAVDDSHLDYVFDRAAELLDGVATNDPLLTLRLDELRDRNRERLARRYLASVVRGLGLDLPQQPIADRLVTRALHGEAETTLLALRPLALTEHEGLLWAGIQLDLASLFEELTAGLEEQLARTGQQYRIELVDAGGRSIVRGIDALADQDRAGPHVTRHSLGPPLPAGFSLLVVPRDPQRFERATRRKLIVWATFLLALALFAGAGAFLLVHTVHQEAELANLKTEFVGRVSHELKTPLALIRMYGETLAMGRVDDPQKVTRFAGIIAKESDRLQGMIDNVLDFSRIEAGTKVYEPVPTRLDYHLEGLLDSYRPHMEEAGFELLVEEMPPLIAEVDPEGLTQAVVNLLSNARKYTEDDGEKRVEVHLLRRDQEACIEVWDRGVGVPEPERERIFDTFYRAATAGERRGAGLGLALVRHFATAHGGTATHEPRPGGGSIFRVALPLAEADESG